MRTMTTARLMKPRDIRVVAIPIPDLRPHEVLCRVKRAGVCATDYAIYTGEFSFVKSGDVTFPMTLGHEWSGVVEDVGTEVENFTAGDRVVGDTAVSCGVCYECLMGQYGHCKKSRPVGTIHAWDGAYAEYIVMPERHLFHLPENVSFDNGAMVEPAATALYSVKLAGVEIGDTVLVHGTGPIGILAGKLAKLSGASVVCITGRKKFKLDKSLALGIDAAIDTTSEDIGEALVRYTGQSRVDRIIEASGSVELLKTSLDLINPGGVISVVAFYEKKVDEFDIDKFVFGDVTLRAVAGSLGMYRPVLRLLQSGMLDCEPLITGRYRLEDAAQALLDMKEKNQTRIKMMIEL